MAAPAASAREYHAAVLLDGKIYIIGGWYSTDSGVFVYDPSKEHGVFGLGLEQSGMSIIAVERSP